MKIRLVKERTIRDYVSLQARAAPSFQDWLLRLAKADCSTPIEMVRVFGSTDLLGKSSSRIVFDIGGNNYRMICKYVFTRNMIWLYICWIGTHAEYDKLCARNAQYTVWMF